MYPGANLIKVEKQLPACRDSLESLAQCPRAAQGSPWPALPLGPGTQHLGDPPAKGREARTHSHIRKGNFELNTQLGHHSPSGF